MLKKGKETKAVTNTPLSGPTWELRDAFILAHPGPCSYEGYILAVKGGNHVREK